MTTISPEISFPVGVRALMPDEARRRRAIESRCVEVLERAGFGEVILPIVDFVDPYRDIVDDRALRRSYRFTDREGELISIRSDFTPMLARVLAPVTSDTTLRVYYRGDVIRYEPSRLGSNREFFQVGAELLGVDTVDADIELIALAVETLRNCGVDATIAYRDASLVRGLTESLSGEERRTLIGALRTKHTAALSWYRDKLEPKVLELIGALVDGSLSADDLAANELTRSIGERLIAVARGVKDRCGIALVPVLDEVDEESSYYTGIAFDLFAGDSRTLIGSGGRYDALYAKFGNDTPAIGFTLSLDLLPEAGREGELVIPSERSDARDPLGTSGTREGEGIPPRDEAARRNDTSSRGTE